MKKTWGVFSFFQDYFPLIKLSAITCFLFLFSQITTSSIYTIEKQPSIQLPVLKLENPGYSFISRQLKLETKIPIRTRSESLEYFVKSDDSISSIAKKFNLTPETILFANQKLEDNPHKLQTGMILIIPPVNGIYYAWRAGDTLEEVSEKFDAQKEEIINFTGNKIDLTTLEIKAGTMIMVPGGTKNLRSWAPDFWGDNWTNPGQHVNDCRLVESPSLTDLIWPKDHVFISGNEYGPSHLGLDIQTKEGEPVYAAGSGIVTQAANGWNYGYGNVIQIDHGNGYVTVYGQLSMIDVGMCTSVDQGEAIGFASSIVHFEVRINGSNVNPYKVIQ